MCSRNKQFGDVRRRPWKTGLSGFSPHPIFSEVSMLIRVRGGCRLKGYRLMLELQKSEIEGKLKVLREKGEMEKS
jgi:hypothetical protein